MLLKIQKWGNSQGLRLSKHLLEDAQLDVGDEVEVTVNDGVMVVKPIKKIRGRYKLEDLVVRMPQDDEAVEVDLGEPVGREIW